jgi:predicted dehydrogenase
MNIDAVLNDPKIDAVIITTPVASHFALASQALHAGKHVIVTKPMVCSASEADTLRALAKSTDRVLLVDHTFLYTGAVGTISELVNTGEIGDLLYYDSVRINLGLFQSDVNVLWDLAPHDLSILFALTAKKPSHVSAVGMTHFAQTMQNIAYLTIAFEGFIAHLHVNWLSPVKIRKTILAGSKKMIVWDDLDPEYKLKVYDSGVTIHSSAAESKLVAEYRIGAMYSPVVSTREAIATELSEFATAISSSARIPTSALTGRRVAATLEAAEKSMLAGGAPITIADWV